MECHEDEIVVLLSPHRLQHHQLEPVLSMLESTHANKTYIVFTNYFELRLVCYIFVKAKSSILSCQRSNGNIVGVYTLIL
jgi:hypothetical protein